MGENLSLISDTRRYNRVIGKEDWREIRIGFLEEMSLKSTLNGWVGFGQMEIVLGIKGSPWRGNQ